MTKQIRKCIRDKKKDQKDEKIFNEHLKSAEVSRTYPASNQRGRECSFTKLKMTKARQSHREKGSQMSSANSAANFMKVMKLKRSFKIL